MGKERVGDSPAEPSDESHRARRSLRSRKGLSLFLFLAACGCAVVVHAASLAARQAGQAAPEPPAAPRASAPSFHEETIAEIPPGSEVKEMLARSDHLAWVEKSGDKWTVRLDGKRQGGTYEGVERMGFAAGAAHLAFFGKRNSKWVFVLDGEERSPAYASTTSIAFQPRGPSFAYGACAEKKKCSLFVDGKEAGETYEEISYPQYSPDGKHLAYFGKRGGKWVAIVDGKQSGSEFDGVSARSWGFSPQAGRFFCAAWTKGHGWTYMVDGSPGPAFKAISPIAFSGDDQHYTYAGAGSQLGFSKQKITGTIVLDGQTQQSYEGQGIAGGWTWLAGTSEYMLGGLHSFRPAFHGVSDPRFNPEGKLVYAARSGKNNVAVLDGGQAGPAFDDVASGIVFSGGAKHFAYVGRRGGNFVEVRDNQPEKTFPVDAVLGGVGWILLSADGTHCAFVIVRGGNNFKSGSTQRARRTVVLDGRPGKQYDALSVLLLQPSRAWRHYSYVVLGAEGKRDLVVVDGQESQLYDDLAAVGFDSGETEVTFFARRASRLIRVSFPLP
jgi:hypothetical protein